MKFTGIAVDAGQMGGVSCNLVEWALRPEGFLDGRVIWRKCCGGAM